MPRRRATGKSSRGGENTPSKGRVSAPVRRSVTRSDFRPAVASPDAEDIALARLQAHLRRTESLHAPTRPAASSLRRTTIRLPAALLDRLRDRARRDGMTASEVVELAVERLLRSR
jgi:hypothetical protein